MISKSEIIAGLSGKYKNIEVTVFDEIDSTNRVAKEMESNPPQLVVADSQTAGRGRLGRSFYSPANTGIYMSIKMGGFSQLADGVFITSAAAVAVTDAIFTLTGIETGIKWVNDIYHDGKKICGILAESVCLDGKFFVVVGIGLNLTTAEFPEEISEIAGSLRTSVPREAFIAEITKNLLDICENREDCDFMERYRKRSIVIGKEINYFREGVQKSATAIAVDPSGGLVVRDDDGNDTTLSTGEITVRLKGDVKIGL